MKTLSTRSTLLSLSKARLIEVGRGVGVSVAVTATKDHQVEQLLSTGLVRFGDLLQQLGRDELKAVCRSHSLDDSGRARRVLAGRLLEMHGAADSVPPKPLFQAERIPRYAPRPGDIVACRHRQWLVEDVSPPPEGGHATRVRMVCLDDDNPGRPLEVYWERELGAGVVWSDIDRAPSFPSSDADLKALQAFQDEVIDRLFQLNAQRAAHEKRRGLQ